jgi:hypothetical protein
MLGKRAYRKSGFFQVSDYATYRDLKAAGLCRAADRQSGTPRPFRRHRAARQSQTARACSQPRDSFLIQLRGPVGDDVQGQGARVWGGTPDKALAVFRVNVKNCVHKAGEERGPE